MCVRVFVRARDNNLGNRKGIYKGFFRMNTKGMFEQDFEGVEIRIKRGKVGKMCYRAKQAWRKKER